jgi:hypothetical protein
MGKCSNCKMMGHNKRTCKKIKNACGKYKLTNTENIQQEKMTSNDNYTENVLIVQYENYKK